EILEHSITGYLIPVNAPTELAAAINYVLNNPDEAQRMASAGYAHMCKTFSLKAMLGAYRKHYAQLLGKKT
ncbi:MAG: glycosyltransferase, partial [Pseudomonadota bacterium]|nr:glycosyltransferase [Pseudomonadota bacterium]